jgi:hypothetical protein
MNSIAHFLNRNNSQPIPERKALSELPRGESKGVIDQGVGMLSTFGKGSKATSPNSMSRTNSQKGGLINMISTLSGSSVNHSRTGSGTLTPPVPPAKRNSTNQKQVKVIYDFDAEGPGELTSK